MHTWYKTCRAVASPLAVRIVSGLAAVILFAPNALSQSGSLNVEMAAVDLARKVVTNELRVQNEEQSHWMYRLEKEESGKKQVQEILETNRQTVVLWVDSLHILFSSAFNLARSVAEYS